MSLTIRKKPLITSKQDIPSVSGHPDITGQETPFRNPYIRDIHTGAMFQKNRFEKDFWRKIVFALLPVVIFLVIILGQVNSESSTGINLYAILIISGIYCLLNLPGLIKAQYDMTHNPLETTGMVESKDYRTHLYTWSYTKMKLKDNKTVFRIDSAFLTKVHIGDKVRIIYTPALKLVKEWEIVEEKNDNKRS